MWDSSPRGRERGLGREVERCSCLEAQEHHSTPPFRRTHCEVGLDCRRPACGAGLVAACVADLMRQKPCTRCEAVLQLPHRCCHVRSDKTGLARETTAIEPNRSVCTSEWGGRMMSL